ncbi:MAG: nitrous oxide reductase accessory protein NosL [Saprospiraceae bacterium]|nr:nitrous oxide reductase accessory protein NosL [Saprospiraceae bacterium]
MKNCIVGMLLCCLCWSCRVEPQAIPYGEIGCAFCQMTVVNPQFAAELVSSTGKVYFFDAIECMIHYQADHPTTEWAFALVNDYFNPHQLIDAAQATYLISSAIPSPMGANLSASEDQFRMKNTAQEQGGETYSWTDLKIKLNQ